MDHKPVSRGAAFWLALGLISGGWIGVQPQAFAGSPWDAAEMDWPYWRGPEMNNTSREKNIPAEWSPDKPGENNLLWKSEEGGGRSTPIVMDGLLYTIVRDKPDTKMEGEKVVCLDAATGEKKWENSFNVYLSDVPAERVGWSCVVGDPVTKKVFVQGVSGYFACIDAKTGKTLWARPLHEEFGLLSTYGGRTNMPITYKNMVLISAVIIGWGDMARPTHRFLAFNQDNGELLWFNGTTPLPEDTTYSSPVLAAFNGEAALVFNSGDGGVHAFQPETGKRIWSYTASARGISSSPLVIGNKVIAGHNQENVDSTQMGALIALDGTKHGVIEGTGSGLLWRQTEMYVGKCAPIHVDGKIFVLNDPSNTGTLLCVDLETGQLLKKESLGGSTFGSPLYVDGKIYVMTESARWWVFQPTKGGFKTVSKARLKIGEVFGSPIVSHGRLYVTSTEALYCIADPDAEPAADKRPDPPKIDPPAADPKPAWVQVTPVETLLGPGGTQKLQVRLYNAKGQDLGLVKNQDVTFEVQGVGSVKDGVYSTPAEKVTSYAIITAKVGELTGMARARVIPPFPWSHGFNKGDIPMPWVGVQYRHVPMDFDLMEKLHKQNVEARELYIYLQSSFVNSGLPAAKYDDSTARKGWTEFAQFMKILDIAGNLEASKSKIDPLLEILKKEQLVKGWTWETWTTKEGDVEFKGIRLTVQKGPREIEGNGVMMKITTIPKGMRSQGWMGPVNLSNYTIEADVFASDKAALPDIGLIGQGYTFDLMGASQQLQIRTWTPQLERMSESVPFPWKARTWYRLKFRTAVENDKAVLRGKVWEVGQPEPKDWQITAEDARPTTIGSPGFFGNAKDSELFYDNVEVYANPPSKG